MYIVLSVSEVARVTESKYAHSVISKLSEHCLELAYNPYLSGQEWVDVLDFWLVNGNEEQFTELALSAQSEEQINAISLHLSELNSKNILADDRSDRLSPTLRELLFNASGWREIDKLFPATTNSDESNPWYKLSEENRYILNVITPKLDECGMVAWEMFIAMLNEWENEKIEDRVITLEDILRNIESLTIEFREIETQN